MNESSGRPVISSSLSQRGRPTVTARASYSRLSFDPLAALPVPDPSEADPSGPDPSGTVHPAGASDVSNEHHAGAQSGSQNDRANQGNSAVNSPAAVPDADPEYLIEEMVVPAEIEQVVQVRNRIAWIAESRGMDEDAVEEIRLAVGEAFVNAVRHGTPIQGSQDASPTAASRESSPPEICVRVFATTESIAIEVKDCGAGFDPDRLQPPRLEDLKPNGRGVYFMQLAMDEVNFEFDQGTLVRMVKRLHNARTSRGGS